MDKLLIFKRAVSWTASLGAGAIVGSIVDNNVPKDNIITKVTVPVGSFVIGSLLAETMATYTDKVIDDIALAIKKAVEENQSK